MKMNSSYLGYCEETLQLIKFLNIENAAKWIGERTLTCDCREAFNLKFAEEKCSTVWTYFCRDDFIAAVGDSLTISQSWVDSFNTSFIGLNYDMADLPVEVPVLCEMTYKSNSLRRGFLLSAEKERVFASVKQSYAMTIAQIWLSLLVLSVMVMFLIKQCSRKAKLLKRSFEKYEDNGKDIDVYLVGSVKDKLVLEQLKCDLTRFNYTVMATTDNLLPNQHEVNPEFSVNATRIKTLVHIFSPGILTKVSDKFHSQKEHTWFHAWFDEGMNRLRDVCNTSGIQKICVTVFAEFEGGKSNPTPEEREIKDKIETELAKVNKDKLIIPIVELSKGFKQCLPVKNNLGPYEIDRDYQASLDKLLYYLPVPRPTAKSTKGSTEEPPSEEVQLIENA